ncbi:ORF6N domain-containing protein [Acinetobacter chinensis]|uniref:ORF6N domain-containing protein n=1 Tax=Acinetobacter chinensis TaxID=2004650 RepID=A0A3B7M0L2_9GAMM|nr:ORF6N domain-containing protein [Acinetobacter chinensis]
MNTRISASQNQVIRFKKIPVVTTAQLAEFYGTEQINIKQNFSRNLDRFVEGKHYFKLEGLELKEFKNMVTNCHHVPKRTARLILWTERGAARHAKMLDTDHAWDVFERLEDSYFKQAVSVPPQPAALPLGQNNVYLPNKVGRFFVENKQDGTVIIRDANKVTVVRRRDMDVVKKDCQTIRQELELFLRQIEKMENSLAVDDELLPMMGKLNWRGV